MWRDNEEYEYDVCLSFAGEQRNYVEAVVKELNSGGVRCFYDLHEQVDLWGKNLYEHLSDIYHKRARFCVMFISKEYGEKVWPNHERASAQARAFGEKEEYILPARFDSTEVPGLLPTIGYLDLNRLTPKELSSKIQAKLYEPLEEELPDDLSGLYAAVKAESLEQRLQVDNLALDFFKALHLMSRIERDVVFHIFYYGCCCELPENVHIRRNLLARLCCLSKRKLKSILDSVKALGFEYSVRTEEGALHDAFVVLSWHDYRHDWVNATEVASGMILGLHRCDFHNFAELHRLDFGGLSYPKEEEPTFRGDQVITSG